MPFDDTAAGRRRPWLTLVFAVMLAIVAHLASGQGPVTQSGAAAHGQMADWGAGSMQYDAATALPGHAPHPQAKVSPHRVSGGAVPRGQQAGRAVSAEVEAELGNFDADADPDGWRVLVVLRDRSDRPTTPRATATFELTPRVSTLTGDTTVSTFSKPVRWSVPLHFDDDGAARVKLPLRSSLKPLLGWTSANYPSVGSRSPHDAWQRRSTARWQGATRSFVTTDLYDVLGHPRHGQLRVRVSVPGQGLFEAVTPVQLRPSVLVDTQWPSR